MISVLKRLPAAALLLLAGLSLPRPGAAAEQPHDIKIAPVAQSLAISLKIGPRGQVSGFAYTPDGSVFVSLSPSAGLYVWDGANGLLLRTLDAENDSLLAMSPDGKTVATADVKGTIRLWELSTGQVLRTLPPQEGVKAIGFSPDGTRIASTDHDGTLFLTETGSGSRLSAVTVAAKTASNGVHLDHLAFTRDSRQIVLAVNRDVLHSLAVVDVASGKVLRSVRLGRDSVRSLSLSPDGRRAAVVLHHVDHAQLWDLTGAGKLAEAGKDVSAKSIAFSADGSTLVLIGSGASKESRLEKAEYGLVEVWNGDGSRLVRALRLPAAVDGEVSLSPDHRSLLFTERGQVRVLDLEKAKLGSLATGEVSAVVKLAFSPDGGKLAMGSFGRVHLLDFDHPGRSGAVKVVPEWVSSVAFRRDGRGLSIAAGDETVAWDLSANKAARTLDHTEFANSRSKRLLSIGRPGHVSAAYDTSGALMALTADNGTQLQLWDQSAGEKRLDLAVPDVADDSLGEPALSSQGRVVDDRLGKPALSGDGRVVAAMLGRRNSLVLWNTGDGRELARIKTNCADLVLNRDGSLAACAAGGEVKLIDTTKGEVVRRMKGAAPLRFGADDTTLFTGAPTATVRQWDTRSGALLQAVRLPGDITLTDFAVSPDGKAIATAGSDRVVRIFSGEKWRQSMTVALVGDGWVVMTPEGYYDASSPEAENALQVRNGDGLFDVLPVASYRERFYRPDIIREILAGKGSLVMRASGEIQKPPRLKLGSLPAQVFDGRVDLAVSIQDQGGGVGDLRVYVNGTAVVATAGGKEGRGITLSGTAAVAKPRTISLRLPDGHNEISVIAFNADNSVSCEPVRAVVDAASQAPRKPRLHALIVGIDRFENPAFNLRYAVNDAKAVAEVFRRQTAGGLFEKVDVELLTEPAQTTRAALVRALEKYRDVAPEDVFVFYVASHGTVEGDDLTSKEYFLITSNVGSASVRALKRDAISQQEMKNLIGNIPAGKKTLLLDTCHSGALGLALQGGTRGLAEDTAVKVLSNAIGSTVISASTSQQQSLEGYENHGVFSWVLLQALGGKADVRGRGFVTTLDLAGYVEYEVPRIAEKVFNAKQFPNLHTSGQAFPLVMSR
jgi:WD40 repeat protein